MRQWKSGTNSGVAQKALVGLYFARYWAARDVPIAFAWLSHLGE